MNLDTFLENLYSPIKLIQFEDTMTVIDSLYEFTETGFINGNIENKAGENSGSCKLFAFAQLQGFDKNQTLKCFGQYYRDDVLKNLNGDNHQNIRSFMKTGWQGIKFSGCALQIKQES